MLMCVLLSAFAHETAGAARTRSSLRPLFFRGERLQASGAACRENAELRPAVFPALRRDPYAVCARFGTGADAFDYN